jgi:outer membrane protein TolC
MADQASGGIARARIRPVVRLMALVFSVCTFSSAAFAQPPVVDTARRGDGQDGGTPATAVKVQVILLQPLDSVKPVEPPEAPGEIEPLAINEQWSPLKLNLTDVVLPTDKSELIRYLAEGYFPQEAELTIDEAVSIALKHNHDLNSKRLSAAAACQGIEINWAALKPQASLQAKTYLQRSDAKKTTVTIAGKDGAADKTYSLGGVEKSPIGTLALSLTQRIYDWGLTHKLIDASRAQYSIKNYTVDIAEQQLVANVITGYYQFSAALGQARIRRDELALASEFLRLAQIQFEVGTAPRLDVIRAEARVEQARDTLIAALSTLGNAASSFYAWLGVEDQRYVPAVITASLIEAGAEPPAMDEAAKTAVATRPEVALQYATLSAGQAKIDLARNRPILQAYTNALLQDPAGQGGAAAAEFGLQLNWSLSTGGKDKLERQQAQLELQSLAEAVLDLEARIELDATGSWNRLYSARASVQSGKKSLELSAEVLRAAAVGYAAGVTPYIDFQSALDGNVAAALGYLMALVEVKLAQVDLDRAEGFPGGYPGDTRAGIDPAVTVQDLVTGTSLQQVIKSDDAEPAGSNTRPE